MVKISYRENWRSNRRWPKINNSRRQKHRKKKKFQTRKQIIQRKQKYLKPDGKISKKKSIKEPLWIYLKIKDFQVIY